jgi:hypothetical protein
MILYKDSLYGLFSIYRPFWYLLCTGLALVLFRPCYTCWGNQFLIRLVLLRMLRNFIFYFLYNLMLLPVYWLSALFVCCSFWTAWYSCCWLMIDTLCSLTADGLRLLLNTNSLYHILIICWALRWPCWLCDFPTLKGIFYIVAYYFWITSLLQWLRCYGFFLD